MRERIRKKVKKVSSRRNYVLITGGSAVRKSEYNITKILLRKNEPGGVKPSTTVYLKNRILRGGYQQQADLSQDRGFLKPNLKSSSEGKSPR